MADIDAYCFYLIHMSYTGYSVNDMNCNSYSSLNHKCGRIILISRSRIISIYQCRFNYKLS